jgi:outer membrane receptor protein involved in Fe transport
MAHFPHPRLCSPFRRFRRTLQVALPLTLTAIAVPALGEEPDTELSTTDALFEFEQDLEEMVSVSSFSAETLDRAPAAVVLVNRKQIQGMGARTLADVLRLIPGVDIALSNNGVVNPSIRGLDQPADILLLIDGQRVNSAMTGAAQYTFPASLIERVEVIRGPGSALYGSNAFLGVISVTTRKTSTLEASARYGSFNSIEGSVIGGQSDGNWMYRGFVDFRGSEGPGFVLSRDYLSDFQPEVSQAPGRINGEYESLHAGVTVRRGPVEVGGLFMQNDRGPYVGPTNVLAREGRYQNRFMTVWSKLDYELTNNVRLLAQLNANQWQIDDRVLSMPPGWSSRGSDIDVDGDGLPELFPDGLIEHEAYRALTLGADLRLAWTQDLIGRLTFGTQASYQGVRDTLFETNAQGDVFRPDLADYNNRTFPEVGRTFLAPYLLWERWFADWIGATAGLRYDHYSDFGAELSPMAVLVLHPWELGSVKLLFGRAFRSPTLRELHSRNNLAFGNPDLKAETIQTYEVSIGQHFLTHYHAQASVYYHQVKNRIEVPQSTSWSGQNPFLNRVGTTGMGADIQLSATWANGSSVFANLAYQQNKDETIGLPIEHVPHWLANLGWNVYVWEDLHLGGNLRFRSERTPPQFTFFQRDALRGHEEPATWMLDLSLKKDRIIEGFWARLSAYNVLDTPYREVPLDSNYALGKGRNGTNLPTEARMVLLEVGHLF